MYSTIEADETLLFNHEEKITNRIGKNCYKILLDASDSNTINQHYFMEMAYQMSPSIAGNVQRHVQQIGGYNGSPSLKYLFSQWFEKMPQDVSVDKVIRILQSDNIKLNSLAEDLIGAKEQPTAMSMGATRIYRQQSEIGEMQELECPVCLEMMLPPTHIWQCAANHLICEHCKNRMADRLCPSCRTEIIIGRAYTVESIAARVASTSTSNTSRGAIGNIVPSYQVQINPIARTEVKRSSILNIGAARSTYNMAPINPNVNENIVKKTVRPIEQLLEQSQPLFTAFRQGRAGFADMRNICEQMKIMGSFNSAITSIIDVEMDARMKELMKTWYMKEGRSVANIETLIQILLDVSLGAIVQEIIDKCNN